MVLFSFYSLILLLVFLAHNSCSPVIPGEFNQERQNTEMTFDWRTKKKFYIVNCSFQVYIPLVGFPVISRNFHGIFN